MFESLPSWKTYIFPYVVCKALYLCIFPWVVTEMDPSHVNNFPDVQAILGIFVPWFGFWVGSQHLLWGDLPVGCHMSQSYSFKRGALGIWEFFFFLIGESELMLQIYHVQEAVRSLWVFWGATHTQLQSFGSPCRALGPAKAISAGWGQSPGWTMIMGWFLTSISGFFGIFQEQRHLVVFFPWCSMWADSEWKSGLHQVAPGSFSRGFLEKMLWTEVLTSFHSYFCCLYFGVGNLLNLFLRRFRQLEQ